jgi:hypothetical protein
LHPLPCSGLSALLYDSRDGVKASLRVNILDDGTLRLVNVDQSDDCSIASTVTTEKSDASAAIPSLSALQGRSLRLRRRSGVFREATSANAALQGVSSSNKNRSIDSAAGEHPSPGGLPDFESDSVLQGPVAKPRHSFHAMPTPLLREATLCFERAVREAVEAANAGVVAHTMLDSLVATGQE